MSAPPDSQRLSIALLCSLLLHALWLLPTVFGPARAPETGAPAGNQPVLITRLPSSASSQPPPAAGKTAADQPPPQSVSAPLPIDPKQYYGSDRLSRAPRPLTEVRLDIPEASLLTTAGKLVLTLWIDEQGLVTSFRVDSPDLPEEYTTAVAEAFSATRFAPGEIRGRKVNSILQVEISHGAATGASP